MTGIDSHVDGFRIAQSVAKGDWNTVKGLLKDATSDDVRMIRAIVSSYLRTVMSNAAPGAGERAAVSILELCAIPYDEPMLLAWLHATLWRICLRYRKV